MNRSTSSMTVTATSEPSMETLLGGKFPKPLANQYIHIQFEVVNDIQVLTAVQRDGEFELRKEVTGEEVLETLRKLIPWQKFNQLDPISPGHGFNLTIQRNVLTCWYKGQFFRYDFRND